MFSPSAARNREPIREVFLRAMPARGRILEIGSGTGEHAVHLAAALPEAAWLPGDPDAASRASIAAWTRHAGLSNVAAPHALDVARAGWHEEIAGPFAGAGALLAADGKLFLYGPFRRDGRHTAPSNAAFDAGLKARDPRWGVRDLDGEIAPLAAVAGLALEEVVAMPANNFSVVFARARAAGLTDAAAT